MILRCNGCGHISTNKPGITNHIKTCVYSAAIAGDKFTSLAIYSEETHPEPTIAAIEVATRAAIRDAIMAVEDNNKSAARRARHSLLRVRDALFPLRQRLLKVIGSRADASLDFPPKPSEQQ